MKAKNPRVLLGELISYTAFFTTVKNPGVYTAIGFIEKVKQKNLIIRWITHPLDYKYSVFHKDYSDQLVELSDKRRNEILEKIS